jgi:hypothetical protein
VSLLPWKRINSLTGSPPSSRKCMAAWARSYVQCGTVQCSAVQCSAVQCYVQCSELCAVPTMPAMRVPPALTISMQCSAVQCSAVQCRVPPGLTISAGSICKDNSLRKVNTERQTLLTSPEFKALYCTALHCTALHCTALHCTALV